jgi:hypothetical protein
MQLEFDVNACPQYTVEPDRLDYIAAVQAILSVRSQDESVKSAKGRNGYICTDSWFGIRYPGDLDGSDLANGDSIQSGFVEVLGGYGDPDAATYMIL